MIRLFWLTVGSGLLAATASAQDSLVVNYLNDGGSITGEIVDSGIGVDIDAYVGSLNETFTSGGVSEVLPFMYCVDIEHEIGLPTDYPVQVEFVDNAAAWLMTNEGYPAGGLTDAQDAGLQLAIWDVVYPGVSFLNVTGEGGPQVGDPTYWENVYLTADDFGLKTSFGIEFLPVPYGPGQRMLYAPPPGSVPGPLAFAPFLTSLLFRRRRR